MGREGGRDAGDSLRGLTAPGPSRVGVDKAMRARDVSRADAERLVPEHPEQPEHPAQPERQEHRPTSGGQSAGGAGSSGSSPDSS